MGGCALGGKRASRKEIEETIDTLRALNFFDCCEKYDICGSYRRGKPDSGDIDIVFIPNRKYHEWIEDYKEKKRGAYCDSILLNDIQIDLFSASDDNYYCQKILWTGPPNFNLVLKGKAILRNMFLSAYGLYYENRKVKGIKSEKDIFRLLNMEFIKPEDRG